MPQESTFTKRPWHKPILRDLLAAQTQMPPKMGSSEDGGFGSS
jgi:hypothetical protein